MNPFYRNDRYFIPTSGAAPKWRGSFCRWRDGASVSGRLWSVIGGGLGKKQKRGFRQGEKSGGFGQDGGKRRHAFGQVAGKCSVFGAGRRQRGCGTAGDVVG